MIEKCKQYWPSTVGNLMKFPRTNMSVTFNESKPFADYCINVFTLKRVSLYTHVANLLQNVCIVYINLVIVHIYIKAYSECSSSSMYIQIR